MDHRVDCRVDRLQIRIIQSPYGDVSGSHIIGEDTRARFILKIRNAVSIAILREFSKLSFRIILKGSRCDIIAVRIVVSRSFRGKIIDIVGYAVMVVVHGILGKLGRERGGVVEGFETFLIGRTIDILPEELIGSALIVRAE